MAFYGVLLGLGVAELLNGFANLLREKNPPKLGWVIPLLGLLILTEMIANFADAWSNFRTLEVGLVEFVPPALIGILYYVAAVTLMPRELNDWTSLTDYFYRRRRWIVGSLICANLLVIAVSAPRLLPYVIAAGTRGITVYIVAQFWLLGGYLVLLFANRPRVSLPAIALLLLYYLVNYGPYTLANLLK
ncbi:hypothetical protein P1X14_19295 [Sphingomonas sp. AOB5]|uniref:hypothetical protein n=1 Tax=Sphingomonas sp. AOB5 TaxID=3034017 RepID=UPI0023F9CA09|nr:hypothetical protein [Sphingomonas sp. AOB5]MDF7777411.1 hypothetical protein [Sphingomonas sp. AOB5]